MVMMTPSFFGGFVFSVLGLLLIFFQFIHNIYSVRKSRSNILQ
jgi:hypothetical protein